MLLVIFGAGASFDSVPASVLGPATDPDLRPPLANGLFESRRLFGEALAAFPSCAPLARRLQRTVGKSQAYGSLEQELYQFQIEAEGNTNFAQHLVALRFYLQRVVHQCGTGWHNAAYGNTNYVDLLSRVNDWRMRRVQKVVLVTFNYDRMIEHAAPSALGLNYGSMDSYIQNPSDVSLIKVHGSVDWGRVAGGMPDTLDPDLARGTMIENANRYGISDEYVHMGSDLRPFHKSTQQFLFPALSIPAEPKSNFSCPKTHLSHLETLLPRTSKILVIGWRATEQHFLKMLKTHCPKDASVQIVAGRENYARDVELNLEGSGVEGPKWREPSGFSAFLESTRLEEFLKAN